MTSFELKWINPPGGNSISKLPPLVQSNVLRALRDGILYAEKISQEKYLTGPRPERLGVVTGLLRKRVRGLLSGTGGDSSIFASATLGVSGVKYARIHELGGTTPAHTIEAKNVPMLKFFWKKKGIWMKIRKVNHPGSHIPARPYLEPALLEARPNIERLIQAAIDKAYKDS